MAEITTGVQIQGTLTTTYDEDNYAVTDSTYGLGGYREVTVVAALTNPANPEFVPLERQRKGMLVYATDTDLIYKLVTLSATLPVYTVLSTSSATGLDSNYQVGGLENTINVTATDGPIILTQDGIDPGNFGMRLNGGMRMQFGAASGTLWSLYRDGPPILRLNCTTAAVDTPGDGMFFEAGTGGVASATGGGVGGTVDFKAGTGGAAATGFKSAGAGGAFYYTAGAGGAGFANESPGAGGGSLVFNAGKGGSGATAKQGGQGGGLTVTAGAGGAAGGGTEGFGGTTNIKAGASLANIAGSATVAGGGTVTGTAGTTYIEGGHGGGTSKGGDAYLRGGNNTSTGDGGDAYIRGGSAPGGTVGDVFLGDLYTGTIQYGSPTSATHLMYLDDANTDAFVVKQGTGPGVDYLKFDTTTGSEVISVGNTGNNPAFAFLGTGTASFGGDLLLAERTGDPSTPTSAGYLYTKDPGATQPELFFMSEDGVAQQITPASGGTSGLNNNYLIGDNTIAITNAGGTITFTDSKTDNIGMRFEDSLKISFGTTSIGYIYAVSGGFLLGTEGKTSTTVDVLMRSGSVSRLGTGNSGRLAFGSGDIGSFHQAGGIGSSSNCIQETGHQFNTNPNTGTTGGVILRSGSVENSSGNTGAAQVETGPVYGGGGSSGPMQFYSGYVDAGGGSSGAAVMYSGYITAGGGSSGPAGMYTGYIVAGAGSSGLVSMYTGEIQSGASGGATGKISFYTGRVFAGAGDSGLIEIYSGINSGTGNSGDIRLATGSSSSGTKGVIDIDATRMNFDGQGANIGLRVPIVTTGDPTDVTGYQVGDIVLRTDSGNEGVWFRSATQWEELPVGGMTPSLDTVYTSGGDNTVAITNAAGSIRWTNSKADNIGMRLDDDLQLGFGTPTTSPMWSIFRDTSFNNRLMFKGSVPASSHADNFEVEPADGAASGGGGGSVKFRPGDGVAGGDGGVFYVNYDNNGSRGGDAVSGESGGGNGGRIEMHCGHGGAGLTGHWSGDGGGCTITAGNAGDLNGGTGADGGPMYISAGDSTTGKAGMVTLYAGDSTTSTAGDSGRVIISAGWSDSGNAGKTSIYGGGTSSGTAGDLVLTAGGAYATGGTPANVYIKGGGTSSTGITGGNAHVQGGASTGTPGVAYLGDLNTTRVEVGEATSGSHLRLVEFTTTQRNAIATPLAGAQIYNTTTDTMQFYDGAVWADIGGGGAGNTLNAAYDQGGAGAGRQIDVDQNLPVYLAAGTGTPTEALHVADDLKVEFGTGKDDSIRYDSIADRLVVESATEIDLAATSDEILIGATAPTSGGRAKIHVNNSAPAGLEAGFGRGSLWIDMNVGKIYINTGASTSATWIVVGQQQI